MSSRAGLAAALALGLLARGLYAWKLPPATPGGGIPNIDNYVELASSVAATGSLRDAEGRLTAKREPGYPIALGAAFAVLGRSYRSAVLLNLALSLAILFLIWRLGGPLPALIAALYPPFVYYAAQPVRETLMVCLELSALVALLAGLKRGSPAALAASGALGACAALTKTTYLPFGLLVVPLLVLWRSRRAARAGLYAAVFAGVYALWPLRNHALFHEWILGSTTATGNHFYMFLVVPEEVGGTPKHYEILAKDPIWQEGDAMEPIQREKFFWRQGLLWIRAHPLSYARIVAGRLFYDQWRLVPRRRDYEQPYSRVFWISLLTDGWLLPLGFLGLALTRLRGEADLVAGAYILSTAFTYALILTMLRYRLVLMPWLILYAADSLRRARARVLARR
jgi:hypothetical protein